MSLTTKIFIDDRYTKKDGSQAIKLRVTINRKSLEIPMGFTIDPKFWNVQKMEIKSNCKSIKNVTRLNNILKKKRVNIEDQIISLQQSGELDSFTSMSKLKKFLQGGLEGKGILEFSNSIINELQRSWRTGNSKVYKTMRNSLKNYLNDNDIPMKSIDFKWLKSYEAWYLGKGNSINGLSVHMRTLRALLNRAIKENILSKESYAFENYSIKTEKTKKRAVSESDINKIKNFTPTTKQQQRAKDYFLISFYLMGASFVDIAHLKLENIKNGRIEYRRKKTGQLHSIKITQPLMDILDRYTNGKSIDDYILDVIRSEDKEIQYIQTRDELKRYNKRLKDIGKLCGIEQPLTSYVARHSYATIAKFKEVPTSVISEALGHQDTKTTQIYLAQFGNDILDKYNDIVLGE